MVSQKPLWHSAALRHALALGSRPAGGAQWAAKCTSNPVPGNPPNRHEVPAAHWAPARELEQQVSAQMLPAQAPERQSSPTEHAWPPIFVPSVVDRPSQSGRTQ
jgi:hypothetical protein